MRHLIALVVASCAIAPAVAAERADVWTRKIDAEVGQYGMEHRDGLALQCTKQGGVIRVTLPGVLEAPVAITAGTERAALLEQASDETHTRGVLFADNAVIPAIMQVGTFTLGGRAWALDSDKDKRDVALFFRICKAS